jgi:hypothetical protein
MLRALQRVGRLSGALLTKEKLCIIPPMDTTEVIQTIDAEIARLEKARALLNSQTASPKRGRPVSSKPAAKPQRRKISAEGRARIAAAQKARWAKAKR